MRKLVIYLLKSPLVTIALIIVLVCIIKACLQNLAIDQIKRDKFIVIDTIKIEKK